MDKSYFLMLASAAAGAVLASAIVLHATASTSSSTPGSFGVRRSRERRRKQPTRRAQLDGHRRVCVVCTGSVAAVKAAALCRELIDTLGVRVDLVLTHAAEHFQGCTYRGETGWNALEALQKRGRKRDRPWLEYFGGAELLRFLGRVTERESGSSDEKCVPWLEVWTDYDEWNGYNAVGDPVLHVDLAKRGAVLVVAPLCAHSLATMVSGAAPNLAASVFRAWHGGLEPTFLAGEAARADGGACAFHRPIVVAPAMNTIMWHQRTTQRHLAHLRHLWGGLSLPNGANEGAGGAGDATDAGKAAAVGPEAGTPRASLKGESKDEPVAGVPPAGGLPYESFVVVDPVVKTLACGDRGNGAMADVMDIVEAARGALDGYVAAAEEAEAKRKALTAPPPLRREEASRTAARNRKNQAT